MAKKRSLEQNSAKTLAEWLIYFLQKLNNGSLSLEQLDWFCNLSFNEREKLLGKVIKKHLKIELVESGLIIPELNREIIPEFSFLKESYYLGDSFNKHIFSKVNSINNLPRMSLSRNKFIKLIYDTEIMDYFKISKSSGLMKPEEILWIILNLTGLQLNGEEGVLLTNNFFNIIGYILCDDGIIRVVYVNYTKEKKWACCMAELALHREGFQMLSYDF